MYTEKFAKPLKQTAPDRKEDSSNINTSILTKHNVHRYLVSPKQNGFSKFSSLVAKFIKLLIFSH